jgi:tetratricopeptide (TPR) repeat protein
MKMLQTRLYAAAASLAVIFAAPFATTPLLAQDAPASVHGHINNAAGQPVTIGDVKFTKDKTVAFKDEKFSNTFPIDGSGNYKGTGLAPGDYRAVVVEDGKLVDYQDVTFKAGEDATLDFDMTRAAFLASMTPEQKKELEEYKKKNSEVMSANQVINKLNATLKTVRADLAAAAPTKGDVSTDVTDMKQAVDAKPDTGLLWITYGDTLQAQGDHLAAADKAAGKPAASDDAVQKEYSDASDAYKKGIDVDSASKKPSPEQQAAAYNQMGDALAKSGKVPDATAAFESAGKADPTHAGMYYNNEAAIEFNAGQSDAALAAAEKAIAADPNRPDPYFIKGQVLIAKSTFDAKTQKLAAPPGCVEAYQKYLELAPNGSQAPAVREVLQSLGEKIDTKYKAGKKS